MALLTATNATVGGTLAAPTPVSASDTINGNLADTGAILRVTNGSGGSINVTLVDPGKTKAGNTGTQSAVAVAAGTSRYFPITSAFVNPATNLITVTFSATPSVTAEVLTAV